MLSKNLKSMRTFASYRLDKKFGDANVHHWRGQEITFDAEPAQPLWIDGEPQGKTPFTATVIPAAIQIVVP